MLLVKIGYKMRRINFGVAKATLTYYCILLSLNFISTAEVRERGTEGNRKRTETDPVSSLFSELGDLFLDIDRSLAIHTAPKVEFEDELAQILKPPNRYFSNVQENYRTLQKGLGALVRDSIAPEGVYGNIDLSVVRPPNIQGGNGKIFASKHSSDLSTGTLKVTEKNRKGSPQPANEGNDNVSNNECSPGIINNPFLDSRTSEKCSQRLKRHVDRDDRLKKSKERFMLESRRKNQFVIPFDPNEFGIFPDGFLRRDGDIAESETKPEGRVIGDVLYSESLFDRNIRQLLRDHGKWILDNPLLVRWRQPSKANTEDDGHVSTEALTKTEVTTEERSSDSASDMKSTPAYIPVTTEFNTEVPVSEETYTNNRLPRSASHYYRILDSDGIIEEEVDIVLKPESDLEVAHSVEIVDELNEKPYSKETVTLAFTPDGLPLKLRMGPEIENPVRFLHKVLNSAGVSLNVPVKSYDDIEPVGKEVMKFGTGVLTRAVYFDLSNTDELKTLLKTLMKSKASGKSKF